MARPERLRPVETVDENKSMSIRMKQIRRVRQGVTLLCAAVLAPLMLAVVVVTVDVGRVFVARGELQAAADAAARYAAAGMSKSSNPSATAYSHAASVAAQSRVDGNVVPISAADVVIGRWNSNSNTFVANANNKNAVKVTLTYYVGGSGSTPTFAQLLGAGPFKVRVSSIATAATQAHTVVAPASGNIWLSGMPNNTVSTNLQNNRNRYDNSGNPNNPKQRPQEVRLSDLGLSPGDLVSFEGLSGQGNWGGGNGTNYGPDGNTNWKVALGNSSPNNVPNNSMHGIANVRAPISAVMAVFLDDNPPNTTAAPSGLDFNTQAQRDYTLLEPAKKQPFFVGDGKTSSGEVQYIRIPAGATRIFLGMMDAWQWNDNTGSFQMSFYRQTNVATVD